MAEALSDPHAVQRGMVVEVEASEVPGGKVSQIGSPIHMSDTPGKVRHVGSVTGQHTQDVLLSLGYSREQVNDFKRREVTQ